MEHISEYLKNQHYVVTNSIEDTIKLTFSISENGTPNISEIKISQAALKEIPDIKNEILNSVNSLPKIYPAIKRGQQVKTEFKLPIIIKVD